MKANWLWRLETVSTESVVKCRLQCAWVEATHITHISACDTLREDGLMDRAHLIPCLLLYRKLIPVPLSLIWWDFLASYSVPLVMSFFFGHNLICIHTQDVIWCHSLNDCPKSKLLHIVFRFFHHFKEGRQIENSGKTTQNCVLKFFSSLCFCKATVCNFCIMLQNIY